ncbi:MAG: glycosyltransferase family 2 protein [Planctomycetota bacterium]|nr:glycosyltransferase family 2 protein [Planctomycetota bacterium]
MANPRISVITPSLNRGHYIERTICSVIDQGYPSVEHWVVDGGSHDQTLDMLLTYDAELAGWTSRADKGPADAINTAPDSAKGDIIAVLPADHLLLPGALKTVAAHMGRRDGPDWLIGGTVRIGPNDELAGHSRASLPDSLAGFLKHDSGVLPSAATFYRAQLFRDHGRFDPELRRSYDYEFACRLMAAGCRPTAVPEALVASREHPARITAHGTVERGLEYINVARRYAEHLPLTQRYALWRNCDLRERIYALAQSELRGDNARSYLWGEMLRHPWWLADESFRRVLRHGQPTFSINTGSLDAAA